MNRTERIAALKAAARERILILDGSWGVMIQRRGLDEADFLGDRFVGHEGQMKGNNDILCLTRPDIVTDLHNAYFEAGADISETNTFSATTIAQDDYKLDAEAVRDINLEGAKLARAAADAWTAKTPDKPRFAAGSIGPLNKMLSMSSNVNDPGHRAVTFDEVYDAYRMQVQALNEGGVDLYLIETITDTLNCKAAIKAIMDLEAEGMDKLPIWISGTITDRSGRTLSGQTVAAYPNAGLPNEMGQYDETPDETSNSVGAWAKDGIVNILGGCCGTTPEHIAAIAKAVDGVKPRDPVPTSHDMRLSGLEPFVLAS